MGLRGVPGRAGEDALLIDVTAEVLAELIEVNEWPFTADILEGHREWVSGGGSEVESAGVPVAAVAAPLAAAANPTHGVQRPANVPQ
eukprot:6465762-Amphidinium_carterae.1